MIRRLALVGDSITAKATAASTPRWADVVTEQLGNIVGIGPIVSSGFLNVSQYPWSYTSGTWGAAGVVLDLCPYGLGKYGANGSGSIYNYTHPTQWRPIQSFDVYYGDYSNAGNFQYSIDGGAWTNMGQDIAQDGRMCKFHVPSAVTSTIDFRQYNGSSSAGCCLYGIEVFYLDPLTTTQGLIVHNLAVAGTTLSDLTSVAGRMNFFDSVFIDAVHGGGAISSAPNAGILVEHINDANTRTTTQWSADHATLYSRIGSLCPVGYWSWSEMHSPAYDATTQADFRQKTKDDAALHSIPVLDFYDIGIANGYGTTAGTQNAALMSGGIVGYSVSPVDNGHPTTYGHKYMAPYLYWFIRNNILSLGDVPLSSPVQAPIPSVSYIGAKPSISYSAELPIKVG